jgi:hypothetical protein
VSPSSEGELVAIDAELLTATVRAATKIHALGRPLLDAGASRRFNPGLAPRVRPLA